MEAVTAGVPICAYAVGGLVEIQLMFPKVTTVPCGDEDLLLDAIARQVQDRQVDSNRGTPPLAKTGSAFDVRCSTRSLWNFLDLVRKQVSDGDSL